MLKLTYFDIEEASRFLGANNAFLRIRFPGPWSFKLSIWHLTRRNLMHKLGYNMRFTLDPRAKNTFKI
jgi:hypothetical protein